MFQIMCYLFRLKIMGEKAFYFSYEFLFLKHVLRKEAGCVWLRLRTCH